MDMLEGKKLLSKDGTETKAKELLKNKKVVVYFFSASWIKKKEIVGDLKAVYQENLKRGYGIEIIYVSADSNEKEFKHDFLMQGSWKAIPFKDKVTIEELKYKYDVTSLPQIVVVKTDGDVVSLTGLKDLERLGKNVLVTWTEYIQQ